MRNLIATTCLILLLSSCSKIVEQKKENAIIEAMTSGQWVITNFVHNGNDLTTSFSEYRFQYYSNNTVDAIKSGSVEKTGTWNGDVNTMSISAYFSTTTNPLVLINGTWHIDDNSWTYVVASQANSGDSRKLRLEKR